MKRIDAIYKILEKETKKYKIPIAEKFGKRNPFRVLISCLLSLRTKDETTAKASIKLFSKAKNCQEMLKLTNKQIERLIYPVGFYKTKAKRIKEICKTLIKENNGKVPDNEIGLLKLKGVGRKTMNIVRTVAFKQNGIAVDTHVHKISNRTGLIKTKTPEETEFALMKILPKKYWIKWNYFLVVWGQNICKPISPFCSKCQINKHCDKMGVKKSR